MNRALAPSSALEPAPSAALATLGMVALLLSFLTERLLPCCAGRAETHAPVLRLQGAMTVLAALAWCQIESPSDEDAALDAIEPAALAMIAALKEIGAALSRHRPRTLPPSGRRRRPLPQVMCPAPVAFGPPASYARDGPERTLSAA